MSTQERDITGMKFGGLTALRRDPSSGKGRKNRWFFRCDCGKETSILKANAVNRRQEHCHRKSPEDFAAARKEKYQYLLKNIDPTILTDRQRQVYELIMQGHSQEAVAAMLHINQSSVYKTLFGCQDYKAGKRYGGIMQKQAEQPSPVEQSNQSVSDALSSLTAKRDNARKEARRLNAAIRALKSLESNDIGMEKV